MGCVEEEIQRAMQLCPPHRFAGCRTAPVVRGAPRDCRAGGASAQPARTGNPPQSLLLGPTSPSLDHRIIVARPAPFDAAGTAQTHGTAVPSTASVAHPP